MAGLGAGAATAHVHRVPIPMRFRVHLVVAALALAACSDATAPSAAARPLVGSWRHAQAMDGWSTATTYRFGSNGAFLLEIDDYGLDGRPADGLSAYTLLAGSYTVEGDQLVLRTAVMVAWDSFYGADSPPQTTRFDAPKPQAIPFEIAGDSLRLTLTSYPADAPVTSISTFYRQPCVTSRVPLPVDCS